MLELDAVTKSFGAFELGPIDLTVDDDVLAILGPSGSGKTTLLSLVGGILSPDTGRIRIDGTDLTTRPIEARGAVMMFQSGALFPHMTARENIEYAATSSTQVRRIIDLFDIRNILDQYPQSLSGGEEQRVSLARSLTADPDILLLDEPLSSLDVPIRRRLRAEIRDVFESVSIPVMYVTHDRHEATVVGDELAVITDGQIHQRGPPQDVLRRPDTQFVARFTGSHNIFQVHVAEDGPSPSLRWDGRRLIASSADLEAGKTVSVAVRPECVELGGESVQGTNVFNGTVADYVFEGDVYRVEVHVDSGTDTSLVECLTFPLAFERAEVERGDTVTVRIPPDAVSVLYDR